MKNAFSLFEVGPRDGLQNEKKPIAASVRLHWIKQLVHAGLHEIEVGSIVREDRVPQMAGTVDLYRELNSDKDMHRAEALFWVLTPNFKGVEIAKEEGMTHLSLLASASDRFSQNNVGKSKEDALKDLEVQLKTCHDARIRTRVYLSCAWHCPFEGAISAESAKQLVQRIWDMGAEEIAVSDTLGRATPTEVRRLLEILPEAPFQGIYSLHLHDTYAMALVNIQTAISLGYSRFDTSAGGLGGCPYAKGASGNVATEDAVFLLDSQGYMGVVDLEKLVEADMAFEKELDRRLPSKVFQAMANLKQAQASV